MPGRHMRCSAQPAPRSLAGLPLLLACPQRSTRVLVTHQRQFLPRCDRVLVLRAGRVAALGAWPDVAALNLPELTAGAGAVGADGSAVEEHEVTVDELVEAREQQQQQQQQQAVPAPAQPAQEAADGGRAVLQPLQSFPVRLQDNPVAASSSSATSSAAPLPKLVSDGAGGGEGGGAVAGTVALSVAPQAAAGGGAAPPSAFSADVAAARLVEAEARQAAAPGEGEGGALGGAGPSASALRASKSQLLQPAPSAMRRALSRMFAPRGGDGGGAAAVGGGRARSRGGLEGAGGSGAAYAPGEGLENSGGSMVPASWLPWVRREAPPPGLARTNSAWRQGSATLSRALSRMMSQGPVRTATSGRSPETAGALRRPAARGAGDPHSCGRGTRGEGRGAARAGGRR